VPRYRFGSDFPIILAVDVHHISTNARICWTTRRNHEKNDLDWTAPWIGDTFAINFGSLPPGMMLNGMTGEISGVPTLKESYYITVRAGGFGLCAGIRTYILVVQ
jgi:hypothetical protein